VLVVDDEFLIRLVVVEALEEAGFTVHEAGTGAEALDMLAATPGITVLLTDVGLPGGMTGRALAATAQERHPGLRIMFMTGYDAEAVSAPSLGAEILTKPFAFDMMVEKVAQMARQGAD